MKDFDIKRFSRTFAWNFKASRKEFLTNTVAMFFAFLLFFIISILEHTYSPVEVRLQGLQSAVSLCVMTTFIFVLISGSWIFSNMKTKQQRIMFKMLPASYSEKFLVRYIYVLILCGVGIIAVFCLADATRIVICELAGIEWCQSGIPMFFNEMFDYNVINAGGERLPALTIAIELWALWTHSTYVLGGVFFRRKQFVFISLAYFVLGMAVLWTISKIDENIGKEKLMLSFEDVANILSVVFVALTIFNYWLSFRLFKRMQVINNKWINV